LEKRVTSHRNSAIAICITEFETIIATCFQFIITELQIFYAESKKKNRKEMSKKKLDTVT